MIKYGEEAAMNIRARDWEKHARSKANDTPKEGDMFGTLYDLDPERAKEYKRWEQHEDEANEDILKKQLRSRCNTDKYARTSIYNTPHSEGGLADTFYVDNRTSEQKALSEAQRCKKTKDMFDKPCKCSEKMEEHEEVFDIIAANLDKMLERVTKLENKLELVLDYMRGHRHKI